MVLAIGGANIYIYPFQMMLAIGGANVPRRVCWTFSIQILTERKCNTFHRWVGENMAFHRWVGENVDAGACL